MLESSYNPSGSVTRYLAGLAGDVWNLTENRQTAVEIDALAELLCRGNTLRDMAPRAEPLFWVLPHTKGVLQEALETRALANSTSSSTMTISWGSEAPGPALPPAAVAAKLPPSTAEAVPAVTAAPAPRQKTQPTVPPAVVRSAIDLADWLQRAREDERISPERAMETARRKADAVLSAVGIERIQEDGALNIDIQEMVDSVATENPEMEMKIAETVECGYRIGDSLLRPQKVLVYRYSGAAKTA